jgi:hypothetical protein
MPWYIVLQGKAEKQGMCTMWAQLPMTITGSLSGARHVFGSMPFLSNERPCVLCESDNHGALFRVSDSPGKPLETQIIFPARNFERELQRMQRLGGTPQSCRVRLRLEALQRLGDRVSGRKACSAPHPPGLVASER